MNESKRITMKLKTPNPLFQEWLMEWRDKARKEKSQMEVCFNIALQSLKKYPLPLESGKDCKILKGFGEKLCQMIDNKLKKYQINGINKPNDTVAGKIDFKGVGGATHKTRKLAQASSSSTSATNKSRPSKQYFPQEGSGGYAILVTLFTESLEPRFAEYLSKQEIIEKGQHLSHTSFTKPDPGNRYTAWSSMKTLISKNLVIKKSKPPKFSLTCEGLVLAKKLFDKRKCLKSDKNTFMDISEYIDLPSCSAYSSSISPETLPSSDDCSSKCVKYQEQYNIDKIKDSITSLENRLADSEAFSQSSVSSLGSVVDSHLINKNCDKTIKRHVSNSSVTSSTTSLTQEECFTLLPNSFDIILYIDTCETSGSKALIQDDPILAELKQFGIAYEVQKLKVGDYIWICRDRTCKRELVLPYVVERKRMDDFGQSIKDGRYYEQKFRLKKSGIQNVIYLIENFGSNQHVGLPIGTLYQAATNTAIQDGFNVKFTQNIRDTARYLIDFSTILIKTFRSKMLVSCLKKNIVDISLEDDTISLLTFKEFNHTSSKNQPTNVSDLFVKMLIQIKGMSVDRALAIVSNYPTPVLLKKAYNENPGASGEKLLASIQFGDCNNNIGLVLSKIVHQLFTLEYFN